MELFEETIKCLKCENILKKPVVLPCGHSMCKSHEAEELLKTIYCRLCDANYEIPSCGFIPNKSFEKLLEKNIEYAYLRKEHKAALDKFEEFVEFYENFKTLRTYPEKDVHKTIGEMRARIESRRDEAKHKIDEHATQLLKKLDDYANECNERMDTMRTDDVDEMLRGWEANLRVWRHQLGTLQRDVQVWKNISTDSTAKLNEMKSKFKQFKNDLYLNRLDEYKKSNLLFDTDYDMIKNHVLSLEVPNISQYKNICEAVCIENEPIRAHGVDWKIRVNLEGGDQFLEIFLITIPSLKKENIFVEFDLVILNWHDRLKSLIHNISGRISSDEHNLGWTRSIRLNDLMNNEYFYDAQNDSVTVQAILKKIEWKE